MTLTDATPLVFLHDAVDDQIGVVEHRDTQAVEDVGL